MTSSSRATGLRTRLDNGDARIGTLQSGYCGEVNASEWSTVDCTRDAAEIRGWIDEITVDSGTAD